MRHLFAATALSIALTCQLALAASAPDPAGAPAASNGAPQATANIVRLPAQNVITIDAGTGRVIQLSAGAASVFAADPKVAEVHPASATSLFIFGVAPGRTTIAALSAGGGPIAQYDVIVRPSRLRRGRGRGGRVRACCRAPRSISRRCRTASPSPDR